MLYRQILASHIKHSTHKKGNNVMKQETLLKIIDWATGDDTGVSSEALCRFMLGLKPSHYVFSEPSDEDDRGRCIRLLNLVPEWWDRLDEMVSLPSHKVLCFTAKINEPISKSSGWTEQIPLIKKEAGRLT